MITIQELLKSKNGSVWTIRPDASVFAAAETMSEKGISALPVVQGGKLVGIISDRDCTRRVMIKRLDPEKTKVRDVMTSEVVTVTPQHTLEECMKLIHTRRLRHLPVLDDGKLAGLISIGDVLKEMIAWHEQTIKQLEKYIAGN